MLRALILFLAVLLLPSAAALAQEDLQAIEDASYERAAWCNMCCSAR